MIRRQLPAYSPLRVRQITGAARTGVRSADAARSRLAAYLAERFGATDVVLTGSGTHALQLALSVARAEAPWADRPVALPAYSCFDIVTAAVGANVPVLFYDVDPVRLVPSRESVEWAVGQGAGTLVAANLYGFPLDWTWLRRVAEENDLLLVEDAAQGVGSRWENREGGSFGDLTVLSFGRGKGWTGGSGGALLARKEGLEASVDGLRPAAPSHDGRSSLRTLLVSTAQWALGRPSLYKLPTSLPWLALGETVYKEPSAPGGMNAFAAAAALAHRPLAQAEVEHRRARAKRLRELWQEAAGSTAEVVLCEPLSGGASSYLRFPVVTTAAEAERMARDGRDAGLARGYPVALGELPAVRERVAGEMPTPGAEKLASALVTLPTHSLLSDADLARSIGHAVG